MKLLPSFKTSASFNEFQGLYKSSGLENGLDDTPLTDDDAAEASHALWLDMMNDSANDNSLMTLTKFLEQMTLLNAGFKYQMFQGSDGKITGCIWQTAVMRDNFERFGCRLSQGLYHQNDVRRKEGRV
jgi:hypothetical protein